MKGHMLALAILCAAAVLAGAQAAPPRIIVVNTSDALVNVRIGEDAAPALRLSGLAAATVSPLLTCSKAGRFTVSVRAPGQPAWATILENLGEGSQGGPQLFSLSAGGLYAIGVVGEDGYATAYFQELAAPAGNRPKVLFAVSRMGPGRSVIIASKEDARDGITVEELVQFQVRGLYELPSSGKRSIFFAYPGFYEGLTHPYPDARDPSKPAVFDFQDGGIYAVLLQDFDEARALASFTTVVAGAASPATGSATAVSTGPATGAGGATLESTAAGAAKPALSGAISGPAAPTALTAVPASWNGDWAEEARPTRRALAVHDGRIFLVMGSSETETFPGTTSRQYTFTYSEREVATLLDGKPYERYVLSEDGKKLTHTLEGLVTVYVRLAK